MERFWRSPRPTARCGHSVRAVGVGHATALGDDDEDDSRLTTDDGRMTGFNRIFNPKAASILNWLVANAVHF